MEETVASTQTASQPKVHVNNDAELFSYYINSFTSMKESKPELEPMDVWFSIVPTISNAKTICESQLKEWTAKDYFKLSADKRYKPALTHSYLGSVQEKAMLSMCIAYLMLNSDEKNKYDMPDGTCFFARTDPFPKISLGKKFVPLTFDGNIKYY